MLCVGFDFGEHGCMGNSGLVGDASDVSDEEWAFVGRFMGNFPQALSHFALVNAARMLASH